MLEKYASKYYNKLIFTAKFSNTLNNKTLKQHFNYSLAADL